MSTGLTVNKATYGAGSTTVDVTSAVSKKVKDGVLNFTVSPSSLGIDDPAAGQMKTLELAYTINGGKKNQLTKRDNDLVFIDAPPERVAAGLQIVKADYGYAGNDTDVTNAVQDLMKSDGSIDIKVGFKELGLPDPNPNKQKRLQVEYTINGAPTVTSFTDGERFQVSAPAREEAPSKIGDATGSLFGMLFSSVARFCGTLLYVLSILVSYDFGQYFIHPMIWGIVAFFLPFYAFWGLPVIVFLVRLFRSTDIVPA